MKLAHSKGFDGKPEPLAKHLAEVAEESSRNAQSFDAASEARFIGFYHDLGKLGDPFQRRLQGLGSGIDHWSAGAFKAFNDAGRQSRAALLCILGHHMGIPAASIPALSEWDPRKLTTRHPKNLALSPSDPQELDELIRTHLDEAPAPPSVSFVPESCFKEEPGTAMLKTRMLFSALVDADFRMTEQHFGGPDPDPARSTLQPSLVLRALDEVLSAIRARRCGEAVRQVREQVMRDARAAAGQTSALYTLTAPTGSGKTLAMLAFALERAARAGQRRVIVVLPYLTLLQQTVDIYRQILRRAHPEIPLEQLLVEDHSLAETPVQDEDLVDGFAAQRRRLVGNWDAPFIITTSVQFLESLHANRPAACRKLHNIAGSVILLDEVQTLPRQLALPTLATLSTLATGLGCTVVLATATQPAFQAHHETVRSRLSHSGWQPAEIVSDPVAQFRALRRVRVSWPTHNALWSFDHLIERLQEHRRALCIVNLKRHASEIYERAAAAGLDPLFLTTALCPAHRSTILKSDRIQDSAQPCLLIATQCVEAGVDLDFPAVFRAFGPLEAMAQAAGRCNRNGTPEPGEFVVFELDSGGRKKYPDPSYEQAAQVARALVEASGGSLDLCDPAVFRSYFERLYSLDSLAGDDSLVSSIRALDFPEVARQYKLIEQRQINILVPYQPELERFTALRSEVVSSRLTSRWIRRARPLTVGFFPPPLGAPIWSALETVPLGRGVDAPDWRILADPSLYDNQVGLRPSTGLSFQEC